jgi:hypothetical protein
MPGDPQDGAASELRDQIAEAIGSNMILRKSPGQIADAVMAIVGSEVERFRKLSADIEDIASVAIASWRQRAEQAEAALEQYHMLINKMRHGEYPFGGSAADSADILDAALDQAGTEDNEEPNQPVNWQAIVPEVLPAPMAYRLRPGERPRGETTIHLPGDDR